MLLCLFLIKCLQLYISFTWIFIYTTNWENSAGMGFFLVPKGFFSGPTHFEGKSEPIMHEGSAFELPGRSSRAPAFFRNSKTLRDHGLPIKKLGPDLDPFGTMISWLLSMIISIFISISFYDLVVWKFNSIIWFIFFWFEFKLTFIKFSYVLLWAQLHKSKEVSFLISIF
jgi:hypothetical protein